MCTRRRRAGVTFTFTFICHPGKTQTTGPVETHRGGRRNRAGVLGDEMKTLPVKPRSSGRAGPVRACVLSAVEIWECMVRDGFVGQSETVHYCLLPDRQTRNGGIARLAYSRSAAAAL